MSGGRRVAVCGLGVMGTGVAGRLLETGAEVRVWNRTARRATALGDAGATVCATPAEAARGAEAVLLCLADAEALRAVLQGEQGVLAALPADALLICASTVSPADVVALAGRGGVVDAGLLGNGDHARTGELRIFLGGAPEDVERAAELVAGLAKQIVPVGPLGSGMRLKLLMNLLMGIEMQAMAEAAALATAQGLDRTAVLRAIAASGFASPVMRFKTERMTGERWDDPDFRLRLMHKDLRLVTEEAAAAGISLPMASAAADTHAQAVAEGLGDADCAAIARVLAPAAVPAASGSGRDH
ncbi:NAD(P)-dependent oxidoreductase [Streptomyces sp. NPDC003036]|uniref:NAD(P)-dependent oxidoreductase n=1 Tax=Streptomyces sp. NPDC003036 TaxID=3154442 RepID=UPI0033A847FF